MGMMDELQAIMGMFMKDGAILDGECFGNYDDDHKKKLIEIMRTDERNYYKVQWRCGINPFDESYYGQDGDIRIVNVDHFAIKGELKDRLDEFRKIVYDAIDAEYALACLGKTPTPEDEKIEADFSKAEEEAWDW